MTGQLASMATGLDALRSNPVEAVLGAAGILVATVAVGFGLRRASSRLRRLRAQLLVIALAGTVMGALVAWLLATAMILDASQLAPTLAVLVVTSLLAAIIVAVASVPLGGAAHRLADTVAAIEEGDREVRTGLNRRDELGRVAEALDQLTVRLAELEAQRDRLDEERALMLTSVGHDLRSPLAALRAATEAVVDGVAPDPARYLSSMQADIDALTSLVDDILLLSNIEGGRLHLEREAVDLADCCDTAIEALAPIAHERGVELRLDAAEHVRVEGNAHSIGRVVRNLVDNAIRHAPPGSVVEVTVMASPRPRVIVSDSGDGFSPEFRERAFDLWARSDESRSRATGGAGLGLAIAKGLVLAHGGDIWIEPSPGGRVAFELPAA